MLANSKMLQLISTNGNCVCVCFFTTIHKKKIIDHWIKYSKCHVIRSTDTQNITTMTHKINSLSLNILIQFICENERKLLCPRLNSFEEEEQQTEENRIFFMRLCSGTFLILLFATVYSIEKLAQPIVYIYRISICKRMLQFTFNLFIYIICLIFFILKFIPATKKSHLSLEI